MGTGVFHNKRFQPITPIKNSWAETINKPEPYFESILRAQRWDKAVDSGSPITAKFKPI